MIKLDPSVSLIISPVSSPGVLQGFTGNGPCRWAQKATRRTSMRSTDTYLKDRVTKSTLSTHAPDTTTRLWMMRSKMTDSSKNLTKISMIPIWKWRQNYRDLKKKFNSCEIDSQSALRVNSNGLFGALGQTDGNRMKQNCLSPFLSGDDDSPFQIDQHDLQQPTFSPTYPANVSGRSGKNLLSGHVKFFYIQTTAVNYWSPSGRKLVSFPGKTFVFRN